MIIVSNYFNAAQSPAFKRIICKYTYSECSAMVTVCPPSAIRNILSYYEVDLLNGTTIANTHNTHFIKAPESHTTTFHGIKNIDQPLMKFEVRVFDRCGHNIAQLPPLNLSNCTRLEGII